ncbi:glycosyl transferase [Alsobacter soli]|uniref:Glycosyl transferase n=1 Tax=Alsobacter soli TaxID=2109933 RepID=A0A2T1HN74_9HYPH|nr:glycosyltransferase family 2 protein [Alsobacter soli]PSC03105.1 glycosyl transferase [Alsobacter soli]
MDVSIVIATYNRSKALAACLDSVAAAVRHAPEVKVELIVVCNASPNDTPAVARSWAAQAAFPVRVLDEPVQGGCRARNRGMREALGHVVAITDDDCRLAPDYIEAVAQAHAADAVPTLRGGRLELGDPDDLPMTVKTDPEPSDFALPTFPGGFLHGCNFTIPKPVIERVGYFDTRFGPGTPVGAAEDTDYLFRAWKLGVPVRYDPTLVIYHHHGRNTADEVARLNRVYNQSDGAFYAKHVLTSPALLKNIYWDMRNALREPFGGHKFNPALGFSHATRIRQNLAGALLFAKSPPDGSPKR